MTHEVVHDRRHQCDEPTNIRHIQNSIAHKESLVPRADLRERYILTIALGTHLLKFPAVCKQHEARHETYGHFAHVDEADQADARSLGVHSDDHFRLGHNINAKVRRAQLWDKLSESVVSAPLGLGPIQNIQERSPNDATQKLAPSSFVPLYVHARLGGWRWRWGR